MEYSIKKEYVNPNKTKSVFVLYRGEEVICFGTKKECQVFLNKILEKVS